MRKVFLSFLGKGSKKNGDIFDYDPARYILLGKESGETKFVQAAELEILKTLGTADFDEVIIVVTAKSRELHFQSIEKELRGLTAATLTPVPIEDDLSSEAQWRWFEAILEHIQTGDRLTVDLTHGYRAIPIVFSTAINFLQKARGVSLDAVFYGAYDKNRSLSPIVDMKDFYLINEYAEGVSRLIEDADARKLAALGRENPEVHGRALDDTELLDKIEELTNRVRNVDMHRVVGVAKESLELLQSKKKKASPVWQILIGLITDKYKGLVPHPYVPGPYDNSYFHSQLRFIELLLEHKLYMQAFTAMREVIGSVGLIEVKKAKTTNAEGRKQRRKAEVFVSMLQNEESEWDFQDDKEKCREDLMPYYLRLKNCGIEAVIREFLVALVDYRNGFDHGWTSKSESYPDIETKGLEIKDRLHTVIAELERHGVLT